MQADYLIKILLLFTCCVLEHKLIDCGQLFLGQDNVLAYTKTDIPQRKFSQGLTDGGDAPLLNNGNPIGSLIFPSGSVHFNLPDGTYENSSDKTIELINSVIVKDGINTNSFEARGHFKWQQSNLENEIAAGTYFLIKGKSFSPRYQKSAPSIKVPSNIIDSEVDVDTNEVANKELISLGLADKFDYAKPTSLIKFLIAMPLPFENDFSILDFFAGSGTSLHATMQLNSQDGGHRQCILVTNNENNICEEVTYERNKRVIQGYTTPKGVAVEGLTYNNLRYYKTEFMPREMSFDAKQALMRASVDLLCIKENIYTEVREFCGMKFKPSLLRYFKEADGRQMLLIFDERIIEYIVPMLAKIEGKMKVYVFSNGAYAYEDEFQEVREKVEVCALPEAILQAYHKVLPHREEEVRI